MIVCDNYIKRLLKSTLFIFNFMNTVEYKSKPFSADLIYFICSCININNVPIFMINP